MDQEVIEILTSTYANESSTDAATRKERILGTLFARLSVVESRGMWLRLSRVREGDPVSESFTKMPASARDRLLGFLVDEKRLKLAAAKEAR